MSIHFLRVRRSRRYGKSVDILALEARGKPPNSAKQAWFKGER